MAINHNPGGVVAVTARCFYCKAPLNEKNKLIWKTVPCCINCFKKQLKFKTAYDMNQEAKV